ncbi:MAG: hypothetical protein WD510_02765, partial [Balneolaceae bacterium]
MRNATMRRHRKNVKDVSSSHKGLFRLVDLPARSPGPSSLYVFWFITGLCFLIGCTDSFQPLQENDRYFFSIYGYLDA